MNIIEACMQNFLIFTFTENFIWINPALAYFNSRKDISHRNTYLTRPDHCVEFSERIQMKFGLYFSKVYTNFYEYLKFALIFEIIEMNN
jgi:hypothetical protein